MTTATKEKTYTITKKERRTLENIEGQLIALSDITNALDKYSPIALLLTPIIERFDTIRPEENGGDA